VAPVLVAGAIVAGCGSGELRASAGPRLSGKAPASPALRQLERERSRLLDGGKEAFEARLRRLRGHPVVVNQWASWCPPCRYEFPFFQRLAAKYRGRAAFLGVDSQDGRDDARDFLRRFPTPYPHFFDPDADVARVFRGGVAWPTTAFYDSRGRLTRTHPGAYASQAKLDDDIREFALGG
jgi:cytochrome c biogenesis protein CcmG, thiol:disulfide interchange protein DsbE